METGRGAPNLQTSTIVLWTLEPLLSGRVICAAPCIRFPIFENGKESQINHLCLILQSVVTHLYEENKNLRDRIRNKGRKKDDQPIQGRMQF